MLITHDMGVVAEIADNVLVLRQGSVVEAGTTHAIFATPEQLYTRALLAAVPHLEQAADPRLMRTIRLIGTAAGRCSRCLQIHRTSGIVCAII